MSPIVAVLVVLISKFFDFKTAITELQNKDEATTRNIYEYLLMFTLTIAND